MKNKINDISLEKMVAEERLSQQGSEASGDLLIDCAMFPILVVDWEDEKVLYLNEYAASYFSTSLEHARGRKAADFWHNSSQLNEILRLLDNNDQVVEFEVQLMVADTVKRYVLLSARKISYQGRLAAYMVFSDITDRKNDEIAFREREARCQEMFRMMKHMTNTVPDMLWAKDLTDKYIFANKVIREKLLMCKNDESPIGKNDLYFATRERLEGHNHTFGEICVDSDGVVKRNRKPARFMEDGLVRGEYLALDVHKAPLLGENGELIGTVGAGRDVTKDIAIQNALEESDKRFRLLVDNIRDVLWVSDIDFHPTYVTPSIMALSGYTQDEFLALPIDVHMTPKYQKKFIGLRRMMASAIKNKEEIPPTFFEFECQKKDGAIIWVEIITTAMSESDDTLQGFTGVIRDSTKRVHEQKELELAKEVALAASQTKSEFLANMSHEIRTPMNGVLGILQLLRDTPLNQIQEKYVETALSSGKSLLNLISDILDFSKIEAGKIELLESPLELEPLLKSVVQSFESLIDRQRVSIAYSIDKRVPLVVLADASRLKQILFNLVGNAVKFTDQGRIDIELKSDTSSDGGKLILYFTIKDSGRGISEQVISRLFEPFVQEDGSFRRKYGGTGLGLSIVRKLVEMMGGKVQLKSTLGLGTEVSFNVEARLLEQISPKEKDDFSEQPTELPTKRILVVEDDQINAMVISAMLRKIGHQVHLANNGRQALEKVAEFVFDCIFMDIQMPELDGVETTKIIRSRGMNNNRKVPIIALTAHAMKGDRERFILAGMDEYLAKPVEMDSLIDVLQRLQEQGV